MCINVNGGIIEQQMEARRRIYTKFDIISSYTKAKLTTISKRKKKVSKKKERKDVVLLIFQERGSMKWFSGFFNLKLRIPFRSTRDRFNSVFHLFCYQRLLFYACAFMFEHFILIVRVVVDIWGKPKSEEKVGNQKVKDWKLLFFLSLFPFLNTISSIEGIHHTRVTEQNQNFSLR